ncbi:MAG: DNA polymerase III subunit chi, partial [Pseudomonadota bacterium]
IYISDKFENPGAANVVVITDGVQALIEQFERVIDIFDGNDNEQVMQARSRWKEYKAGGHNLDYFQQSESGSWVKKAAS